MRTTLSVSLFVAVSALPLAAAGADDLSFEERVRAQEAIERVYYRHQIEATRSFERAVPRSVLEHKVRTYLKQSAALESLWNTPITSEMLRRETQRMTRESRLPERLRELFAALDEDPFLIQECLARPALASRLARGFFAGDERIHAPARRQAEDLRVALETGGLDPLERHPLRRVVVFVEGENDPRGAEMFLGGDERRMVLDPDEFVRRRAELPHSAGQVGAVVTTPSALHVPVLLDARPGELRLAVFSVPRIGWDAWWTETSADWDETGVRAVALAGDDPDVPVERGGVPCLPDDTWDAALYLPQSRTSHAAVWTGTLMLVWGGDNGTEMDTGSRYDPATDDWTPMTQNGAPPPRRQHTAVWTGTEMIVWGGSDSGFLQSGGRYDPVADTWSTLSTVNAPLGRVDHTAIWTDSVMVVWGGSAGFPVFFNDGGRYDPSTDTWTATSLIGAPEARDRHTAVWADTVMIVWGGIGVTSGLGDGFTYDPSTDTWAVLTAPDPPSARWYHGAVWTGDQMVVWGGFNGSNLDTGSRYVPSINKWRPTSTVGAPAGLGDDLVWTGAEVLATPLGTNAGGRYDPVADTWVAMSTVNSPYPRSGATAVWTGSLMVVWGGWDGGELNSGGRYDSSMDSWTPTADPTAPTPRSSHTATWTGSRMVVWGGSGFAGGGEEVGGRYDPATHTWTPMTTVGAPTARSQHTAVWTGDEVLYWGGFIGIDLGASYDPVADSWTFLSTVNQPAARWDHVAVWTGSKMIVWGGVFNLVPVNTGGVYDAATDTWMPTAITVDTPSAREGHTGIWTGTEMVVWGGSQLNGTGARYEPENDKWEPTSTVGAPVGRERHTAVWTGDLMVVWGGRIGSGGAALNSGGRYDPVTDIWQTTSVSGAPAERAAHSAVWTGGTMIVWGGYGADFLGDGGSYDPVADGWTALSSVAEPDARQGHTAVWTGAGNRMIVWGGSRWGEYNSGGTYTFGFSTDDDGDTFSECDGDCDDADPAIRPGADELCDLIDNNCNFAVDENAEPPEIAGVSFAADRETLSWQSGPPGLGAIHDVARGVVGELPVGSGAAEVCLGSDPGNEATDVDLPSVGTTYWYLVRGRNDCGTGSYGTASGPDERVTGVCP